MNQSAPDSQINDYVMRPKRYENIYGTPELFMALMYLGCGWLGSELESLLPAGSFWGKGHPGHFVMLLWFGLVWGTGFWGIRLIKRHITYPRTGYVAQRQRGKGRLTLVGLLACVIAAAVSGGLALLLRGSAGRHNPTPPKAAAGAASALFLQAHHLGAGRIAIVAVCVVPYVFFAIFASRGEVWKWVLAAGFAIGLTDLAITLPSSQPLLHQAILVTGLVWLLSGALTLYLYIRRTHASEADGE
jgi:hypothetical protein